MNGGLHLASLVLASTTGWVLLVFGALPVVVVRAHPREPLLAAGAWAVVAATAPVPVFHWYLIFAIFCLVAFTKLQRPAGKIWLALTAALGLTLGIIFPLEITPLLLQREDPARLALLYLGGAATALAYAIYATGRSSANEGWQPRNLARGLLIVAMTWTALLLARPYLAQHLAILRPVVEAPSLQPALNVPVLVLCAATGLVLLLSVVVFAALRRPTLSPAPSRLAGLTALVALTANGLIQYFYR